MMPSGNSLSIYLYIRIYIYTYTYIHQKSQHERRVPQSKNLTTKGNAQHCVATKTELKKKQKIHHEQTLHNVDFAQSFVVFYIGCFWLFFRVDALRTRNRKEIQHNVSYVRSASHVRISLKSCNLRRSCRNYFRGIGDALHSSKIKSKWGAASITQLTQKLEKNNNSRN